MINYLIAFIVMTEVASISGLKALGIMACCFIVDLVFTVLVEAS